jgi:hypothetical protein
VRDHREEVINHQIEQWKESGVTIPHLDDDHTGRVIEQSMGIFTTGMWLSSITIVLLTYHDEVFYNQVCFLAIWI